MPSASARPERTVHTLPHPAPSAEDAPRVSPRPCAASLRIAEHRHSAGLLVVTIVGEFDHLSVPAAQHVLAGALPPMIILDLADVSFLGTSGLRVLMAAAGRADAEGRWLGIVADTVPVLRPLRLLAVDLAVPVYPRLDQAIQERPQRPLPTSRSIVA
ncbi:STAS domain-containing protein [Amycolatopsis sp. cmx-4-54]|uniref:STAS domain-containing protein n=1 Tax=Amycolatopsis sp. cmx-4-54 TaxID=2790936 RepID=UPI00397BA6F2